MHVLALKTERLHLLLLLHMDGAEQTTVGREREGVPVEYFSCRPVINDHAGWLLLPGRTDA